MRILERIEKTPGRERFPAKNVPYRRGTRDLRGIEESRINVSFTSFRGLEILDSRDYYRPSLESRGTGGAVLLFRSTIFHAGWFSIKNSAIETWPRDQLNRNLRSFPSFSDAVNIDSCETRKSLHRFWSKDFSSTILDETVG